MIGKLNHVAATYVTFTPQIGDVSKLLLIDAIAEIDILLIQITLP